MIDGQVKVTGKPSKYFSLTDHAEDFYSQSRVQRGEARVTVELDINRPLAHLRWVGGKAIKLQRRNTGGYTTDMAWRQGR